MVRRGAVPVDASKAVSRRVLTLCAAVAVLAWGCGKWAAGRSAPAEGEAADPAAVTAGENGEVWIYSESAGVHLTRTEVTVRQFRACVKAGRCDDPEAEEWCNWSRRDRDDHPMDCMDWKQAKAVCRWLGGRLPTEEEWYQEASAGGRREFPWGDAAVTCDLAVWNKGCGRDSTWPVCSKPAGNSASGLCDMSGNVWEWTASRYDDDNRVVRGGSWIYEHPGALRAAERGRNRPSDRNNHLGARCARAP